MRVRLLSAFTLVLIFSAALRAADAGSVWQSLQQPAFDPAKAVAVSNAAIARDRIRITLAEGQVHFTQPLEGMVFGAAFSGRGRVQVAPPDAVEAQQLKLFTGQETLDTEFTDAAFIFSGGVPEEIAAASSAGAAGARLPEMYADRQRDREEVGAELLPRLFKSILSADRKRTGFFAADLKTRAGWIHVRYDALDAEEIKVGRWVGMGSYTRFDTWMRFAAESRSAAEAWRDPQAKADFRIRGYKIDATVTGGAELRATTQVVLEHRAAGERVLTFDFDSNLRIESVKDAQGAALPFFQPRDPKGRNQSYGDYVSVVLPEPAQAGQSHTLEFKYAGKRVIEKVGNGNFFCQSFGWYPAQPNSFAARADFELNFRSPKRYKLVATGNKVSETTDGDLLITSWKSDLPLAVAGFAFGDYVFHTEKAGNVDIEVYANREADDRMRVAGEDADAPVGTLSPAAIRKVMGAEMANTVRLFEAYFGPYPYKRLAITNIPFSYGQGWPTLIYLSAISFLDSTQRNAMGITEHRELTHFFRAHESSHQWWGHRVGWKSYRDQWMSEGFAQFSGNLYVQVRQNWKEYLSRLRKDKEELLMKNEKGRVYESLGPVVMGHRLSSSDAPRGYGNVIYNKGGFILHMLRMLMWDPTTKNADARFITMMRDFCETFHNKPASTEDFKAIAEKHMSQNMSVDGNQSLDWFFRQYVYGTGVPRYQFQYSVNAAGEGKWAVTGKLIQSGVPDGWKDPLPLYAEIGGKVARLGFAPAFQKETTLNFTLPVKPDKLFVNYNEDLLAEVKN